MPSIRFKLAFNNLIKEWKNAPSPDRASVAADFIQGLLAQASDSESKVSDCLDRLMIRMHDIESVAPEIMIVEPIGNYLFQTIVIDSATTTRTLNPKGAEEEALIPSELLERARKNLWNQVKPEINRRDGEFGRLTFIEADYFGASFISVLDRFTEIGTTYWVSIPNRNMTLLLEPAQNSQEALLKFLAISSKISASAENQYILPFVLEYKGGEFLDLCKRVDGKIEIL